MKKFQAAVIAGLLATSALASANAAAKSKSYDELVFKARLGYLHTSDKVKNLSGVTHAFKNGYVGEVAGDYFFNPNIALEVGVGYGRTKLKRTATGDNKQDHVTLVPVTATLQYHFAPSGQISPYVGAGYSYQFVSGGPQGTKIKNGGGIVGQVGVDVPMNDTMGLNVDVKYTHAAKHDLKYSNTTYKAKLSTITAMVGVAFPF